MYDKGYPVKAVHKNVGNIEMCYKLCRGNKSQCQGWTYNVKTFDCSFYWDENEMDAFYHSRFPFHPESNPIISGPRECETVLIVKLYKGMPNFLNILFPDYHRIA